MSDFNEFRAFLINSFGDLSWTIVMVKAPLEQTTMEFAKMLGYEVLKNVAMEVPKAYDAIGSNITVLKLKESNWSLILYCIGYWSSFTDQALTLSSNLNTQVLVYEAEDTSGSEIIELFENGSKRIRYISLQQQELEKEFKKRKRSRKPKNDFEEVITDYKTIFDQLNIKLIGFYPTDNNTIAIALDKMAQVERVDLIKRDYGM